MRPKVRKVLTITKRVRMVCTQRFPIPLGLVFDRDAPYRCIRSLNKPILTANSDLKTYGPVVNAAIRSVFIETRANVWSSNRQPKFAVVHDGYQFYETGYASRSPSSFVG